MNRYHKKIGFDLNDIQKLKDFTDKLNSLDWCFTSHSLDNLRYRAIDLKNILLFIKRLILDYENIFEYYAEHKIIKACYRVNYNKYTDIIIVLGENKQIITIYLNSQEDEHFTLKNNLYSVPLTKG